MRVTKPSQTAQSLTNRCVMELQRCGIKVTTEPGSVTCLFPPNPDDPHGAPDGEERTYDETYFTLLVTRTFLELAEEGVIDSETGVAVQ